MRVILWSESADDLALLIRDLFPLLCHRVGLPLAVVTTPAAARQALQHTHRRAYDLLVLDASSGTVPGMPESLRLLRHTPLTVAVIHPYEALVRDLARATDRPLSWIPADLPLRCLWHQLHFLKTTALEAQGGERVRLTPKERPVFDLLLAHHSTDQIAGLLQLAPATVKSHVRTILLKLGVSSRRELLAHFGQPEPPD